MRDSIRGTLEGRNGSSWHQIELLIERECSCYMASCAACQDDMRYLMNSLLEPTRGDGATTMDAVLDAFDNLLHEPSAIMELPIDRILYTHGMASEIFRHGPQ